MTTKEFQKLKLYLNKIVAKLEEQAISEGVDVTSEDFELAILELKKKILLEKGISYEDYVKIEQELSDDKDILESDVLVFPQLAKKSKETREQDKAKIEENISELKRDFLNNLSELKNYSDENTSKSVEKVREELDRKVVGAIGLAQKAIEKASKIQRVIRTKEIIRETDNKKVDELKKDIFELQKSVSEWKLPDIPDYENLKKELMDYSADRISPLEQSVLDMPDFRKVAMGLRADVDSKLSDAPSDGNTYGRKNGSWQTVSGGGGGTPGGSDTQVQFNDGGSFGGDAGFTYNKTTDIATLGGLNLTGLTASQLVATDASKNLQSLATATYPSLTEISYVKGVSSAIQTQLDAKLTSPLTTRGDLLTRDGSTHVRLAIGTSGKFLKTDGTDPSWQTITAADIGSGAALTGVNDTNVTLTLGGSPTAALLAATSLTLGWTGTLAVGRGGTGTGTQFTQGSVIFAGASGVYTEDNANFFWDDTNNRLGIGTASPSVPLHVLRTSSGNLALFINTATSGTGAVMSIQADGSGLTQFAQIRTGAGNTTLISIPNSFLLFSNASNTGGISIANSASAPIRFATGGTAFANTRLMIDSTGFVGIGTGVTAPTAFLQVTQAVATSGSPTAHLMTGGAHTTLDASVEAIDINYNLARTVQFSTGALTTQRAFLIQAPTYGFVGASTLTTGVTMEISGAPVAGTNATITNQYALRVLAGVATGIPIIAKGASSQTANLQEWQDSDNNILAKVTSAGNIIITTPGTASGSVVTVDGTQTLTNKTFTAPKFADLGFIADANGNELLILDTVASAVNEITLANAATTNDPTLTASGGDTNVGLKFVPKGTGSFYGVQEVIIVAFSDETTALTTGNAKVTFHMPYDFKLMKVKAGVTTASSSGNPAFDLNDDGVSVFSTTVTIDANETFSDTAATASVLTSTPLAIASGSKMTIDIDTAGTGATGGKLYLIGYATAKP